MVGQLENFRSCQRRRLRRESPTHTQAIARPDRAGGRRPFLENKIRVGGTRDQKCAHETLLVIESAAAPRHRARAGVSGDTWRSRRARFGCVARETGNARGRLPGRAPRAVRLARR